MQNPQYTLAVKSKVVLSLVLIQQPGMAAYEKKDWDAIGFYVNKGDGKIPLFFPCC